MVRALWLFLAVALNVWTQTLPVPLQVSRTYNISSSAQFIDNRSVNRQNNVHTFCANGTGTWSFQLEYSDTASTGPWTSFGSASVVTNASTYCVGVGIGYHPYIRLNPTSGTPMATYAAWKDAFIQPNTAAGIWTVNGNDIYNSNTGNVGIGVTPGAYKLDVNRSGSTGTVRISDQTPTTGITHVDIIPGANQAVDANSVRMVRLYDYSGNLAAIVDGNGAYAVFDGLAAIGKKKAAIASDGAPTTGGFQLSSDSQLSAKNVDSLDSAGSFDVGLRRAAANTWCVNQGGADCTAKGDFQYRHTFCGGTAPTITTHFNTSGDSIAGGDQCGAVTVGSGSATNTGVITFGTAYATAPVCLAENQTTLSQGVQAVSTTTTLTLNGFLFSSGAAQNFTNGVILKWQCSTY